jgi:transposase-like protein
VQVQNTVTESPILKRRTSNPEIRMMHVEKWKQSGMTMSEYCRRNDVALTSLSAWSTNAKRPKKSFKPVVVTTSPSAPISQEGVIEILVDTRLKIRLVDIKSQSLVVNLVKELMRCSY